MRVRTQRFAQVETVEVATEAVFSFPEGIPGFEELERFALVEEPRFLPFRWLQSLEDQEAVFLLVGAQLIAPEYELNLCDDDLDLLDLEAGAEADVLCILTVPTGMHGVTANLRAPVVLNRERGLGKQVVRADERYPIRHPVSLLAGERSEAVGR
ncbi:MAG: flagellar assembly factor FliW [Chloroflexota bacterium]|jgi:flagellar assembly factor FliW|nr:flagellar assembly factor FliW [Chloroflexota bacterium]